MTETQAKLLTYIRQCGVVTPTYREMAEHLGWASHGGVKAVLDALIKMGHIKRRKGADRGLTVVKEKTAWQLIETAPKDMPILAWCKTECDDPRCAFAGTEDAIAPDGSYGLCLYHGHAEGLSSSGGGLQIVEWGGGWSDGEGEGWMPDWWFRVGSEFEESANPTHWMPLPDAPR